MTTSIRDRIRGRSRLRLPAGLAALSVLCTVLVWVSGPGESAAQAAAPFVITPSKVTDLISGEAIEVRLSAIDGAAFGGTVDSPVVRICRSKAQYGPDDFLATNDSCVGGGNLDPASESVDSGPVYAFPPNSESRIIGAVAVLRPGRGTATWDRGGTTHSLTCDNDNPCRLVFRLPVMPAGSTSGTTHYYSDDSLELSYRPEDRLAGCEGVNRDAIVAGMPDRLQDDWVNLTKDFCTVKSAPPPTGPRFESETDGMYEFAKGTRDLAYSPVGYGPGFDPMAPYDPNPDDSDVPPPAARRAMVPVPVGLNAVVVAVAGGYTVGDGTWPTNLRRSHEQFFLTNGQAATLFGGDYFDLLYNRPGEVLGVNPQLGDQADSIRNAVTGADSPLALFGPQATSLFASTYFDTVAPEQWAIRGRDRGVEIDFNAPSVPPHSFNSYADRPGISKTVYKYKIEVTPGAMYALTDYATAHALGMVVVGLPNANGDWVTPTDETLAAAAAQMIPQADGTLAPNPQATAGYPLTFVEYALAPAEPLTTATCAARAASQSTLTDWLGYLTTEGQAVLGRPGGLVPLTDDLRAVAGDARAKVGASPSTCTTSPLPGAPGGGPGPGGSDLDGGGPLGSSSGSGSGSGGSGSGAGSGAAVPETQPVTAESTDEAADEAEEDIELPALLGVRALNDLLPPLSLITIVFLTTGVVLATAGYSPPPAVARVPGQALGLVRRLRDRGLRGLRFRTPSSGGGRP